MQTGIPYRTLLEEDWETLYTYEDVLDELDPNKEPVVDGKQWLIQQAQKYGG